MQATLTNDNTLPPAIKLDRPLNHGQCPPPVKTWGIADKRQLQKLINEGKVDITKTTDEDYIDQVRLNHFRH
jgi:hypothetical protein